MQQYKTVVGESISELSQKRSRFVSRIRGVNSEEEALSFISLQRHNHWDACHNVYAYIINDGNITRYSDDGEPHSTAGIPVLEVIKHSGLTDCIIVVTRYFGGTLLGTGGLVKAYSESARLAISAADKVLMCRCDEIEIIIDYNQFSRLEALISEHGAMVKESIFEEKINITIAIQSKHTDTFCNALVDVFCGSVTINRKNSYFYGFNCEN